MSDLANLLMLGGTGEAVELAERLAGEPRMRVVTSLAGRTSKPTRPRGEYRIGGFGGVEGLKRYLADRRVDLLIDATHPFATTISANAAAACDALDVPRLILARDPWSTSSGDRWIEVDDVDQAARAVSDLAQRIFLAIGRQELDAFAALKNVWFLVRLIEPLVQPPPLRDYTVITGRGPFTIESERRLLDQHRIEAIVARNSGGTATYAKIAAAREMHLPVVMVRPPPLPPGDRAKTVAAAVDWVRRRI
ncbi:MAG: cobalt-precorrin-6A reductase [Alphaproteobacteria bacterium]|nr:cobalt-precorrin-6A reductase [Alphaproteobacteria bacterium]